MAEGSHGSSLDSITPIVMSYLWVARTHMQGGTRAELRRARPGAKPPGDSLQSAHAAAAALGLQSQRGVPNHLPMMVVDGRWVVVGKVAVLFSFKPPMPVCMAKPL